VIFVTVGMHDQPFDRLVRAADELAAAIDEPVVIQRGASGYEPTASRYFDFADEAQMRAWISRARVVVSHGGAGSILSVLAAGRPLVIAPRLRLFGEVFDDHQLELAEALGERGRAVLVRDPDGGGLERAVACAGGVLQRADGNGELQAVLGAWLSEQATRLTARKSGRLHGGLKGD
jgi:UDP-N-acetylglucosamine transferase subunit ALG13